MFIKLQTYSLNPEMLPKALSPKVRSSSLPPRQNAELTAGRYQGRDVGPGQKPMPLLAYFRVSDCSNASSGFELGLGMFWALRSESSELDRGLVQCRSCSGLSLAA